MIYIGNERGIATDTPPLLQWEDLTEDEKRLVGLLKQAAPDNYMFRCGIFSICHYFEATRALLDYVKENDAADIEKIENWAYRELPPMPPDEKYLDENLSEDELGYDDWSKPLPCHYPFLR